MEIDVILVAYSKSQFHRNLTEKALETLLLSEDNIKINPIVVETYKNSEPFKNALTIQWNGLKFNYNACLNWAIGFCKSKYIALCNNDLEFYKNWATNLIWAMRDEYLSASPYSRTSGLKYPEGNHFYTGYEIGQILCGWCLFVKKELFNIIGKLDETVDFWYSDNLYAEQLKKSKIKHILVCNSIVNHVNSGSLTINTEPLERKSKLMHGQQKKYVSRKKIYSINT